MNMKARNLIRFFRVTGSSMWPELREGDLVIVSSFPYLLRKPRPGDIIVAVHPFYTQTRIIKRVKSITSQGRRLFIEGDQQLESEDSHSFGLISTTSLIGKVMYVARRNDPGQGPDK